MPETENTPGRQQPAEGVETPDESNPHGTPAEYVAGEHLAELLRRPATMDLRDALGDAVGIAVARWHRGFGAHDYSAESLEELRAAPVEMVAELLAERGVTPPTRADVARWSEETRQQDPHEVVAEFAAVRDAARHAAEAEAQLFRAAPTQGTVRKALAANADVFDSSPILRHIEEFARARGAGAWATLGNVLVRAVLATPYPVTLPPIIGGPVSLNVLLAIAGVSGAGKDIAHAVADAAVVFRRCGEPLRWPPTPIGTGEGIGRTFAIAKKSPVTGHAQTVFHSRAALFTVRDIAAFDAVSDRRGQTLMPELLKAAHGQELGHANATIENRVILPPHSYRLGLVAGVQPGNGSSLLSEKAVRDGLTQRVLWLPVRDGRRRNAAAEPAPLVVDMADFGVTIDPMVDDEPPLVYLDVAEPIRAEILAVNASKDLDPFGGVDDPLAGHRLLAWLKIAAALALLHGETKVDAENWQRAGAVLSVSESTAADVSSLSADAVARDAAERGRVDGVRLAAADEARAVAGVEQVADRIEQFLAQRGDWIAQGAISRCVTSSKRGLVDAALAFLAQRGRIETRTTEYQAGRSTVQHRAKAGR